MHRAAAPKKNSNTIDKSENKKNYEPQIRAAAMLHKEF